MRTDTDLPRPNPISGELDRWYPSFTPAAVVTTGNEHRPGPIDEASPPLPQSAPLEPVQPISAPTDRPGGPVQRRVSPRLLVVGGVLAVSVATATGLGLRGLGNVQDEHPEAAVVAETPSTAPTSSVAPRPWCDPTSAPDGVIIGNGPGGTDSGPASILAFDFAYYVQRSGAAARAAVTPDAVGVAPTDSLQSAIDTEISVGAEHCVSIRATTPERFLVTLRERRTSGEEAAYEQQVITTRVVDGRHLIASIGKATP